jgi:pyrimidine operon attenuation protein/uracil phosphoribosyltransferase
MRRVLMDAPGIERTLRRLATQIVEAHHREVPLALVGIRRGGVPLAKRLAALIGELEATTPEVGAIDITLYRDDLYTGLEAPSFGATELPFDLDGTGVVLVDDVLFTGRTVQAALGVLRDYGRPRRVNLAVLVDRGHRELPIQADFVGRAVETAHDDKVIVQTAEAPSEHDSVVIEGRGS